MSFDYKTLQAVSGIQPPDASHYCPECGRPWIEPSGDRVHSSAPFPWLSALLGAVSLCLTLVFGLRAASAYQTGAELRRALADPAATLLCSPADLHCSSPEARAAWFPGQLNQYDAAQQLLHRALVPTAFWVLTLLVWLRSLAQWILQPRERRSRRAASLGARIWGVGEALIAVVCLQLLALYVDRAAIQYSLGLPLTWETLDQATDDLLIFISKIAGL